MARIRRRRPDDHDNLERWLVSYADFITLLFAFFVVMYAVSSVNEGKYRVLSNSLVAAFRSVNEARPGQMVLVQPPMPSAIPPRQMIPKKDPREGEKRLRKERMKNVAKDILEVMAPLVDQGKVRVVETSRGVTIEINDSVLFPPGAALLQPASVRAMRAVAEVIAATDFPVTIEGHTDNVPIKTPQFPSNWELSAVRATTVLRLFADAGVSPERLTAIGYGDQRPVESNATTEGRARNRRVTILVDSALPDQATEVPIEASTQSPAVSATVVPGAAR